MIRISGLPFQICLKGDDLRELLTSGLSTFKNQTFNLDLPVLGEVLLQIYQVDFQEIVIVSETCLIKQVVSVKIGSSSRFLPDISGTLQLDSRLKIWSDSEIRIDYKIEKFEWLAGPFRNETGENLKLIEKISSVLLNRFDFAEESIARHLQEQLRLSSLEDALKNLPHSLELYGLKISLHRIFIVIHSIAIEEPSLILKASISLDANLTLGEDQEKLVTVNLDPAMNRSKLEMTDSFVNAMLKPQIGTFNDNLNKLPIRIEHLEVEFRQGYLRARIWPDRFFASPIMADLAIKFDQSSQEIRLRRFDLIADNKTGIIGRGILKLVRTKVEKSIRQPFPFEIVRLRKLLIDEIDRNDSPLIPFKIALEDLLFHDLQFVPGRVVIDLGTELILTSKIWLTDDHERS